MSQKASAIPDWCTREWRRFFQTDSDEETNTEKAGRNHAYDANGSFALLGMLPL